MVFTISEAIHIRNQILQAESAAALERKREGGRRGAEVTNSGSVSTDALPKKPKDRAADRVAKRLGMSEATMRRADQVMQPFLIRFMNLRYTNLHLILMAESLHLMMPFFPPINILIAHKVFPWGCA